MGAGPWDRLSEPRQQRNSGKASDQNNHGVWEHQDPANPIPPKGPRPHPLRGAARPGGRFPPGMPPAGLAPMEAKCAGHTWAHVCCAGACVHMVGLLGGLLLVLIWRPGFVPRPVGSGLHRPARLISQRCPGSWLRRAAAGNAAGNSEWRSPPRRQPCSWESGASSRGTPGCPSRRRGPTGPPLSGAPGPRPTARPTPPARSASRPARNRAPRGEELAIAPSPSTPAAPHFLLAPHPERVRAGSRGRDALSPLLGASPVRGRRHCARLQRARCPCAPGHPQAAPPALWGR